MAGRALIRWCCRDADRRTARSVVDRRLCARDLVDGRTRATGAPASAARAIPHRFRRRGTLQVRAHGRGGLAKSYYFLNDFSRAVALFRTIASDPQHEYHSLAQPWLLELTEHRYDEAAEALSWYPLESLENEELDGIRDEMLCFYGSWHARHGQRELGERLLLSVPESSDYYAEARVALAESMWRAGLEHEALPLYREAVERWSAERAAKPRRERKLPPPEHVELAIERLRSRGVPVSPRGELD